MKLFKLITGIALIIVITLLTVACSKQNDGLSRDEEREIRRAIQDELDNDRNTPTPSPTPYVVVPKVSISEGQAKAQLMHS